MDSYVFITGASSGFGEACASLFAQNGYNLILAARRIDRLVKLSADLSVKYGVKIISIELDVRNEIDVKKSIDNLPDNVKSNLTILINNAGLAAGRSSLETGLISDWNQMIDTNIKGLLYVSQCIIPIFKQNGSGHIFNLIIK